MGKKGDLSDFECGIVVGARWSLGISKSPDLLGFSRTTTSRIYREWYEKYKISSEQQLCGGKYLVDFRGQRRMGRLIRDDRKATVTQITTRYNQGMQNTISERTTHRTLKQMGYSSRRPHRVLLLSAKNRKRRLQFTQDHQNWTIKDCKNVAWSDESLFLLRHSDGRVRIWHKENESMDPSCLVSTVQAGRGDVKGWGIFSWHTLGLLVPIEHCLNATAYLSIVADHVHPFMTTVHPSSDATSSRIMHHVTKLKSSQTGFLNMTMSSLYSNGLHSHQISIYTQKKKLLNELKKIRVNFSTKFN